MFFKSDLTNISDVIFSYNGDDLLFDDPESNDVFPHLTLVPVDGIAISARSNADFDDINFNISFNFGKQSVYSPGSYTELNKEYKVKRELALGFGKKYKTQFNKKNIAINIMNLFNSR